MVEASRGRHGAVDLMGGAVARAEATAVGITAVANLVAVRSPAVALIPLNLATAAAAVVIARRAGLSWDEIGLDADALAPGLRWGVAAGACAVATVAVASRLRAVERVLVDEQAARTRGPHLAYEVIVRVPLATAIPEELLFRGALLAIFERRRARPVARALSALLYGLWHVGPTLQQIRTHPERARIIRRRSRRVGILAGVVAATTAAGYLFAWLRDRSGSVVAPVIAHASLNAAGLLAGVAASRRAERRMLDVPANG